ncbi:MAG: RelA/SpoT domain-containing protein [Nitrospinae bacterium]|nr:RelA/SpoT domain-containing protein [Nitrospinota bacterium]MBL7019863.1 RelA/SpoT domain-containing protein [Nitrospinaceae bacterium]
MKFPTLNYSKTKVNKAGKILIANSSTQRELLWAHSVLSNWRACHGHPINTFQALLRTRIKAISGKAFAAQRLKRTPSIIEKLKRFDTMQLTQMQDIGGLRAVVNRLHQVNRLYKEYKLGKRFEHELFSEKNYIDAPKKEGYRGIHLIFRYKNRLVPDYDGLYIELQLRTKLQHNWATAVETMSTFLKQALKASEGERRWLEYFEIVGSAFAHLEETTLVPGYKGLTQEQTFAMVASKEKQLGVLDKLRGYSRAVETIGVRNKKASYHLVILNYGTKTVRIKAFSKSQLDVASEEYSLEEEKAANLGEKIEVVLVSAGTIKDLKKAYPNYFLDTRDFVKEVESIIASS